ncbi:MAG: type II and III secretion system protein family protein [Burkholderiales bacterium]
MIKLRQLTRGVRTGIAVLASSAFAASLALPLPGFAADAPAKTPVKVAAAAPGVAADEYVEPAEIGPVLNLVMGKSTLLRLPAPIQRISVGDTRVADVTLISTRELYFVGKRSGTTNVILWRKGGQTTIIDVSVTIDESRLEAQLRAVLPEEPGIQVVRVANSIILKGIVSSALKADRAFSIADAYVKDINRELILPTVHGGETPVAAGGTNVSFQGAVTGGAVAASTAVAGATVINMLQVAEPQQVMLEVQVAEISKRLLDQLGARFNLTRSIGGTSYSIISEFLSRGAGLLQALRAPNTLIEINGEKDDAIVRILAEPNIMAISGQRASFLSGGKIFIPVSQTNSVGGPVITLEEKTFGIGVIFHPTVLDGGRINLKVVSEVSKLSQTGSPFTTVGGVTTVLPSLTVRQADTTVQLNDGQSFAIAGLINNDLSATIKRYPVLGEVPLFGALFRSAEFQKDLTELLFVITPRLVKPLPPNYVLPTDNYAEPSRAEFLLGGKLEASGGTPAAQGGTTPAAPTQAPAGAGGFETK